jgi:uncharacterized protein (TIGR03663 family)
MLWGEHAADQLTPTALRSVNIIIGILFFTPFLFLGKFLKGGSNIAAAIALAISPIAVYFSRYYIHETFMAAFMFMAIACAWAYTTNLKISWALATGIFLGLAAASKETITLSVAAVILAAAITLITEPELRQDWKKDISIKHILLAAIATLAIIMLFYSSFFTNPHGIIDWLKAYFNFVNRAGGQGHEKPWYYYFQILGWFKHPGFIASEAAYLITAAATGIAAFCGGIKDRLPRAFTKFMAIYSFALLALYSIVPYKMPWLALQWMQPMTLLSGIGIALAMAKGRPLVLRLTVSALTLTAAFNLIHQIVRENGRFMCDPRNPYVYAHTSTDLLRLPKLVHALAKIAPCRQNIPVMIISDEYWPLPWYLRDLHKVGYYHTIPRKHKLAPILITSVDISNQLSKKTISNYTAGIYGLRRGVILVAFVRNDLWKIYLKQMVNK